MSIYWINYAWHEGPPEPNARYVFLALADNANDGGFAFPSLPVLGGKTRLSESTVRRCIAYLEANGWLQVKRGVGKGNRSQYTLRKVSKKDLLSDTKGFRVTEKRSQADERKVSPSQPKGIGMTDPPYPLIGVTIMKPSLNHQGKPSQARKTRPVLPGSGALILFNPSSSAEMKAAIWFFDALGAPSDHQTRELAAQAIRFQARELGGIKEAAESILEAARAAKNNGETRWRFWFQDSGYLGKGAKRHSPEDKTARLDKKWEEFDKGENDDATQ